MVRRQIYITERQEKILKKLAKEKGITTSEYIRRKFDEFIEEEERRGSNGKITVR